MTARVLMIGLDGADGRRIDRGSADGSLPHLGALRRRGRAVQLTAPAGVTDDALWASFQYESEWGDHGRYSHVMSFGSGRLGKAHWAEAGRPAFWDDLSDQGLRVAIIDVPKCRNPRPINGLHLVDWEVHGAYFPKPRSQPKAVAQEVVDRFGAARPSRCDYLMPALDDDDAREISEHLRGSVAQKRAAGLHYLTREPWDLFAIAFMEAHCACHSFWDFDVGHPAHDPERLARLGDPIEAALHDIDDAVGAFVAAAGPGAEIVAFATSDYQPNGSLQSLMPGIVERLNAVLAERSADWRCRLLPYSDNVAALRIEALDQAPGERGRDPAQLDWLHDALSALRDPATGAPVVASTSRPSTEALGSRAAGLPDMLVQAAPGRFPSEAHSSTLGRILGSPAAMRTGNHVSGGFLIAAGRRVAEASAGVRTMADLAGLARGALGRERRDP